MTINDETSATTAITHPERLVELVARSAYVAFDHLPEPHQRLCMSQARQVLSELDRHGWQVTRKGAENGS